MYSIQLEKEEMEKIFLKDRVRKINEQFCHIRDKSKIVLWGAGRHTSHLFWLTDLLKYEFRIVDNRALDIDSYYGFHVLNPDTIDWGGVTAVIISSMKFAGEISRELREKYKYTGEIVQFYEPGELWEFWQLYPNKRFYFLGDFASFEEAEKVAPVWDESETFEQELKMVQEIPREPGERYWTQWLQKNMFRICGDQGRLSIIDFGGALGQEYFNNRDFLCSIKQLSWVVVDQKKHVAYGKENLQTERLKFAYSLEEAVDITSGKSDLIILAGVLQYIDQWKDFLEKIMELNIPWLVISRQETAARERICIQNMESYNLRSVYRVYNRQELLEYIQDKYELIDSIKHHEGVLFPDLPTEDECWLFKRKLPVYFK